MPSGPTSWGLASTVPVQRRPRLMQKAAYWRFARSLPITRTPCLCCGKTIPPWKRRKPSPAYATSRAKPTTRATSAGSTPANGSGQKSCTLPARTRRSHRQRRHGLSCATGFPPCSPAPLVRRLFAVAVAAPGINRCGMKAGVVCLRQRSSMNSTRSSTKT